MTPVARWTIAELLARYSLEPELDDLFVEGALDREILSQTSGRASEFAAIYEVDCVDLPAATLAKYSLSTGNRQRVVALAFELSTAPEHSKVRCLADRDLDHWFDALVVHPRLRWSAFCSIESHFLVDNCIRDILLTAGRAKLKGFDVFISSLHAVLRRLYALRLTDRELALALKWRPLRKYLARRGDAIHFDHDGYLTALLLTNGRGKHRAEFESRASQWLARCTSDIRLASRGHDFTELLAWAMTAFNGQKEFASEGAIERLFVLLARSVATLADERM